MMEVVRISGSCRKLTPEHKKGVEIFEYEPTWRTIRFGYNYRLFFPYSVFTIRKIENHKTLHLGFRLSPLDENGTLSDQELLFPPFPNIYAKWLLACSPASIDRFYSMEFQGDNCRWAGLKLIKEYFGTYQDWVGMTPDRVFEVFSEFPKTIEHDHGKDGLSYNSVYKNTKVRVPFSDVLDEIHFQAIHHVNADLH